MTDAGVAAQIAELVQLGGALVDSGKLDAAQELFAGLKAVDPGNPEVNHQLGLILATRGDYRAAIPPLEQAVAVRPGDILAHNVLSLCQYEVGDYPAALASADRALALLDRFGAAHNNRGNALWKLGRLAEAKAALVRAVALTPDDPIAHMNLANVLGDLEERGQALESVERGIALDPSIAPAHTNRGNLQQAVGRHEEALESYAAALALDPNSFDARWNRSLCNLLLGRFEAGWREYEWRWRGNRHENPPRNFPQPLWMGEPIEGRTILLYCEQGLGDSIQFIRLAPLVAQRGATVIVEAFAALADLLRTVEGVSEVVVRGEPLPAFDVQCPLMSLPLALGEFGAAPGLTVPYLAPAPAHRAAWQENLGPARGPRIGLVFGGSPTHRADHLRSLPADALLAALPEGPEYHLLQKECSAVDRERLAARGVRIWCDGLTDLSQTAALVELMDLVVSVDTSVAHLAGALARPVRILVAFDPDWRWGVSGEASAWYPTARVLRQAARHDWSGPLAAVAQELAALVG